MRKGGNEMIVYFGEEVENALKTYMYTTRRTTLPLPGHEMRFSYLSAKTYGRSSY